MTRPQLYAEDYFFIALIISLGVHLSVAGGSLFVKDPSTRKVKTKKMEVLYRVPKKEEPKVENKPKPVDPPDKVEKITLTDSLSAVMLVKEHTQQPDALNVYERVPEKVRSFSLAAKKTVSVPPLQSEKINNPSYANYYSLVRGRIKQRAYFNYSEYYAGEVYLTFVLTSDGNLKDLQILEDRTTGGQYLRTIGLKSIKESVPFPPFPKELHYPELTFNVVISFQVKDSE